MPRKSDVSNSVSGNPDIAVALHYDGSNTPRVTAKGENHLAKQIIDAAEQARQLAREALSPSQQAA